MTGQGAVALQNGVILHGPKTAEWECINQAFSSVGIKRFLQHRMSLR